MVLLLLLAFSLGGGLATICCYFVLNWRPLRRFMQLTVASGGPLAETLYVFDPTPRPSRLGIFLRNWWRRHVLDR